MSKLLLREGFKESETSVKTPQKTTENVGCKRSPKLFKIVQKVSIRSIEKPTEGNREMRDEKRQSTIKWGGVG